MNIKDIAKIKVNWMEGYVNDPRVTLVLKKDRKLSPSEDFRYRQYGNLFFAELDGEVRFMVHDKRNHNGFGFSRFTLHMADDWDSSQWKPCSIKGERDHGSMTNRDVSCSLKGRVLTLTGPWSGNAVLVERLTGVKCISWATLEGPSRESVSNPRWYQKMKRRCGHNYDGTALSTHYTLEFAREVIDTLAPHLELWEADYGWTVKIRDMPPKNPRRLNTPIGDVKLSAEQSIAVYY